MNMCWYHKLPQKPGASRESYGKPLEKLSETEPGKVQKTTQPEADPTTPDPNANLQIELRWTQLKIESKGLDEREKLLKEAEEKQHVMDALMAEWFGTHGGRDNIKDIRKAEQDYPETEGV